MIGKDINVFVISYFMWLGNSILLSTPLFMFCVKEPVFLLYCLCFVFRNQYFYSIIYVVFRNQYFYSIVYVLYLGTSISTPLFMLCIKEPVSVILLHYLCLCVKEPVSVILLHYLCLCIKEPVFLLHSSCTP